MASHRARASRVLTVTAIAASCLGAVACSLESSGGGTVPPDAETGGLDGATDGTLTDGTAPDGRDGSADVAQDVAQDSGDARADATTDAPPGDADAGIDAESDAGEDASRDGASDADLGTDASDGSDAAFDAGRPNCPAGTYVCGSRCTSGLSCDTCDVGTYACTRLGECSDCAACPGSSSFGDYAGVGCYDTSPSRVHLCQMVSASGQCSRSAGSARPACDPLGLVVCPRPNLVCVPTSPLSGECRSCGEADTEGLACAGTGTSCRRQDRGVGRCVTDVDAGDGGDSGSGDSGPGPE
ncbi:MAG: hypothetical protein U0169_09315 [Polyangiaceae bacterium]